MLRKIILFKRLPTLPWRPRINEQIIPLDTQNQYPDFKSDFAILEKELMPSYRRLDNEALRAQNQFRLLQLMLIVGSVVATTLGAIQAAHEGSRWPGFTEALVTGVLTSVTFFYGKVNEQSKYFTNRLKAERLRGEYFLFLGQVGNYADATDRAQILIRRVAETELDKD